MGLLYYLSFLSILLQILFITVAIASGLYYLAELVEEYTVTAKKIITWLVIGTTVVYMLLIFGDHLPWSMIMCGMGAQAAHAIILKHFPYVQFLSPAFLGAVCLLVVNHYLAFKFFSTEFYPFIEVLAYFTLCLWLVPFALFISLSANDNVLPTVDERTHLLNENDVVTNYFSSKRKVGLLSLFNFAKESLLPQRNKKSF